jgi:radical SAM-linked protein
MPRVSFDDPIPTGMESEKEVFYMTVSEEAGCLEVLNAMNKQLPEGLKIIDCRVGSRKAERNKIMLSTFQVKLTEGVFPEKEFNRYMEKEKEIVYRKNKRGKTRKFDLKKMVENIDLMNPHHLKITLRTEPGNIIRPAEVIQNIFSLSADAVRKARVLKISSPVESSS